MRWTCLINTDAGVNISSCLWVLMKCNDVVLSKSTFLLSFYLCVLNLIPEKPKVSLLVVDRSACSRGGHINILVHIFCGSWKKSIGSTSGAGKELFSMAGLDSYPIFFATLCFSQS